VRGLPRGSGRTSQESGHTTSDAVLKVLRLRPEAQLPLQATAGASGYDLFACLEDGDLLLSPDPVLVPTGIAIELPPGCDATIRPRSGLASRGVNVILGTIDSDYRGELLVAMHVFGSRGSYRVQHGDRIAQLVITRLLELSLRETDALSSTTRGTGGHGSTGER
jgi:dUTP pyrophosphatase